MIRNMDIKDYTIQERYGKYGCIDNKGNIIIPFIYDYIDYFFDGVAAVEKDGKVGYINRQGEIISPCIFRRCDHCCCEYRFERGDNSLPMYLYHNTASKINKYHKGIFNTFGYYKVNLLVEPGTQDLPPKKCKYYLMFKKIYSRRFSTDCFSDYFSEKSYLSSIGIEDLEEYKTEKATFDEMVTQNSYFFNDLNKLRKGGN